MEIPQDMTGHARPSRPRPAAPLAGADTGPPVAPSAAALPPPVPVTTQLLPLALLSQSAPRARPAGLVAEEGYGAALGIVGE